MLRTTLLASIALVASPLAAQGMSGSTPAASVPSVGGVPAGVGSTVSGAATVNSQGPVNASPTGIDHADDNSVLKSTDGASIRGGASATTSASTTARANSKGPDHASVNGLANASTKSVLGGAGNVALNGLTGGTAVLNASGTSIGTVSGLVKNRAGATVGVQVTLSDGSKVTIPASQLSLSGSTLTTTYVAKK